MENIASIGLTGIFFESYWRSSQCSLVYNDGQYHPFLAFAICYLLCLIVALLDFKNLSFFRSPAIRNLLSILHSMDGIITIFIAISLYLKRLDCLVISLILSTKCFLLSFVARVVTGKVANTTTEKFMQITRVYLHHVGSFIFIYSDSTIILTAIWRFISMTGHALVSFRTKELKIEDFRLSERYRFNVMFVGFLRQIILIVVLIGCFVFPDIRRGFGKYLLV